MIIILCSQSYDMVDVVVLFITVFRTFFKFNFLPLFFFLIINLWNL